MPQNWQTRPSGEHAGRDRLTRDAGPDHDAPHLPALPAGHANRPAPAGAAGRLGLPGPGADLRQHRRAAPATAPATRYDPAEVRVVNDSQECRRCGCLVAIALLTPSTPTDSTTADASVLACSSTTACDRRRADRVAAERRYMRERHR